MYVHVSQIVCAHLGDSTTGFPDIISDPDKKISILLIQELISIYITYKQGNVSSIT